MHQIVGEKGRKSKAGLLYLGFFAKMVRDFRAKMVADKFDYDEYAKSMKKYRRRIGWMAKIGGLITVSVLTIILLWSQVISRVPNEFEFHLLGISTLIGVFLLFTSLYLYIGSVIDAYLIGRMRRLREKIEKSDRTE